MCGITGSIIASNHQNKLSWLKKVTESLSHRGPDYQQTLDLGIIQLGHARLSIIDTRAIAHQPLQTTDKQLTLVFNGEIYNYVELRKELAALGIQFKTQSDAEVLLLAWQQWGTDCLDKLIGMYAFAVWNQSQRTLYLVRDRMGEKPLHYTQTADGGIIFASELSALMQHPLIDRSINLKAISHFLNLNYVPSFYSMLNSTKKLAPATYLVYDTNRNIQAHTYWKLSHYFINKDHEPKLDNTIEEFNTLLKGVTRQQMRSDVPLGVFLSGGLDSSTIAAAMRQVSSKKITAFSADFSHQSFSELTHAKKVARHCQLQHAMTEISINNADDIIKVLSAYDEPFADTSMFGCYYLSSFVRQQVKVVLSGDGADEIFAGYDTYKADRIHRLLRTIPKSMWGAALTCTQKLLPSHYGKVSFDYKLKAFLKGAALPLNQSHQHWRVIFSQADKCSLYQKDALEQSHDDSHPPFQFYLDPVAECHWLDQMLYLDLKTWLVDDILVKTDRASMAHGLEIRSPFLDHRIVEFTAKLPVHWKLHYLKQKYFLKRSQLNTLPKEIIYRKKSGFNSPISYWLLNPAIADPLKSLTFSQPMRTLFQKSYLEVLWQQHQQKRQDNSLKLLGLMSLANWLHKHKLSL